MNIKTNAKRKIHKLHLWVGLSTGLIVFLLSISGALYSFRDEFFSFIHKELLSIDTQIKTTEVNIVELWENAQKNASEGVTYQHLIKNNDITKAWYFTGYHNNHSSWNYFTNTDYYENLYINPITGKILGKINMKFEFFQLIKSFHYTFWLSEPIGKVLIGSAVLLFLFSLITGIIIWLKSKNPFSRKITVNWKATFKRINFDLHNSIGIYASTFGIVFALSGLIMAFKWFTSLVYVLVNLSITPPKVVDINTSEQGFNEQMTQIQKIYNHTLAYFPEAKTLTFSLPHHDNEKNEPCEVYIRNDENTFYNASIAKYNWEEGELENIASFKKLSNGEKILYMNYDIHVGSILGFWGKLLAFITSLMCGALPLTGIYIWWGRRRKIKKKPRVNMENVQHRPSIYK